MATRGAVMEQCMQGAAGEWDGVCRIQNHNTYHICMHDLGHSPACGLLAKTQQHNPAVLPLTPHLMQYVLEQPSGVPQPQMRCRDADGKCFLNIAEQTAAHFSLQHLQL